jgi:hypothetical protein
MKKWLTKSQRRNFQFAVFILANLLCVGGFLFSRTDNLDEQIGGWRRIDIEALTARINAGDLVRKEAAWYSVISDN